MSKAVPLLINPFAGVGAAFQIDQTEKAKKEAKQQVKDAQDRADQQSAALAKQNAMTADRKNAAQRIALNRSKLSLAGTRYPTIMTSPLGLPGNASGQQKKLLGA